ncbi:MAG: hypothetical protein J0I74_13780 [Rhodanobacter sp.]|nr:hypothetical protein [Rhodanobacter sp.]
MNRKTLLIAALVAAALALLVAGFFATFERKDVTETIPPHGAARSNRFLALELMLHELQLPVQSLTTLSAARLPLRHGDTVLLGENAGRVDAADAARLVAWVRGGGHLLLSPGAASVAHTPLFDALGVLDPRSASFECVALHSATARKRDDAALCGSRFRLRPGVIGKLDAAIGTPHDGYLYARMPLGQGTVSVLANFAPLAHTALKQAAAQEFAWNLLQPNRGRGTIYLVYALDGPPFLQFLAIRGWPALLALALLLAAWMAMRSARLGPLLPAPPAHRRALLEHVQAAGEFIYRRDSGRSLHALACQAVLARLRRRDPACAMLHGEALYARLAERSALDAARVAQAFQSPANAQAFRVSILTLARLRNRP